MTPTAIERYSGLSVRQLHPREVDAAALVRWKSLAIRSSHQNPFLWPEFVIAGWEHLTPADRYRLWIVEDAVSSEWLLACPLHLPRCTRELPWPHATSFQTIHSFRSGLLLDAERGAEALTAWLGSVESSPEIGHGIEFQNLRLDSQLSQQLATAAERLGWNWTTRCLRQSPAVFTELVTDEYLDRKLTKSRRKSIRQTRRKLAELGEVSFRLMDSPEELPAALERFLELEADSWKGVAGTALTSNPQEEQFIRDLVDSLARAGAVVISELRAGPWLMATALNLRAGSTLFAFKISWNREFARLSPGVLHEVELLQACRDEVTGLTTLDSCASEDSYLGPLWPERIPIGTALLSRGQVARWSLQLLDSGRRLKRMFRDWR
jgi:CelD/BcsL family acetyltransferase involved in cellulose biosynthesis